MKIVMVGAGAMGGLFGALLAEAGMEVWLLSVRAEHIKALNKHGVRIEQDGQTRSVAVKATTDPTRIGNADLVIIFVKSHQTESAAEKAAILAGPGGLALTLQNGLGNADIIARTIQPGRVFAGTTLHGATMLGPGHIRHAGSGPTVIGPWAGGALDQAARIAATLNAAGIETRLAEDIRSVIWDKLLVNVGINAITALTAIRNGQILSLDSTRKLSQAAVEEAMAVARAQGIKIRENAVAHVFQVARATAANRSSMGQDVDHRRLTEIGAINGAVVREAERMGLQTPVNQTLTALVETLQTHYA